MKKIIVAAGAFLLAIGSLLSSCSSDTPEVKSESRVLKLSAQYASTRAHVTPDAEGSGFTVDGWTDNEHIYGWYLDGDEYKSVDFTNGTDGYFSAILPEGVSPSDIKLLSCGMSYDSSEWALYLSSAKDDISDNGYLAFPMVCTWPQYVESWDMLTGNFRDIGLAVIKVYNPNSSRLQVLPFRDDEQINNIYYDLSYGAMWESTSSSTPPSVYGDTYKIYYTLPGEISFKYRTGSSQPWTQVGGVTNVEKNKIYSITLPDIETE